jgi:hypothetical protein
LLRRRVLVWSFYITGYTSIMVTIILARLFATFISLVILKCGWNLVCNFYITGYFEVRLESCLKLSGNHISPEIAFQAFFLLVSHFFYREAQQQTISGSQFSTN